MTQGCLGFEDASIVTARSNVRIPYISLVGNSWAEYKDFLGQVRIDAALRNTSVSTDDIAWFAPGLRDWHLDFSDIDIEVAGVVADFTAKVRSMHIGEGTTLVADAAVKGLPEIRDTCVRPLGAPPALLGRGDGRAGPRHRRAQAPGQAGRDTRQLGEHRPRCPLRGEALGVRHAAGGRDRGGRRVLQPADVAAAKGA